MGHKIEDWLHASIVPPPAAAAQGLRRRRKQPGAHRRCSARFPGSTLDDAARIYRGQRARYSIARIHELAASCRQQLGQQEAAAADFATALAIYRQLGAIPDVNRLNGATPGGLTAREAQILVLVSGGVSNRQVGQALVISEKTVRRHLANIFGKIGVTSRTAAAGWARADGLH